MTGTAAKAFQAYLVSRRGLSFRGGRLLIHALLLVAMLTGHGCTYVKFATRQGGYHLKQSVNPSQHNLKHMITRQTFFVFGRLLAAPSVDPELPLAVAAFSNRFGRWEVVDLNRVSRLDSYYGLNLPPGDYTLVVLADQNGDFQLTPNEILGSRHLALDPAANPKMVLGEVDIQLAPGATGFQTAFNLKLEPPAPTRDSLFFPKGSIRSLDDPIFSRHMATLGMYAPSRFLEKAPMMFYALEEHRGHKVPVVFVHGIDGSAAQFKPIVERLDRDHYQAWFFHYPSGADLHQTAAFFQRIFLSGKVVTTGDTPLVIVAHSMGGIVVREALNLHRRAKKGNQVDQFISLATPFDGHPAARTGTENAPVVLPSWRDLNPDSRFIAELFRHELPAATRHYLFFASGPARTDGREAVDDGVVPIRSQKRARALAAAAQTYLVAASHTGILEDPATLDLLIELIGQTKSHFPEAHLAYLVRGGYDLPPSVAFTPLEGYAITVYGRYLDALVRGDIVPFHEDQEHFLKAVAGKVKATNPYETAWIKYMKTKE
ncbi:DUF413 domain-containing protein [Acanthopleuribacter pedis]|uniref:Macrodomain Ori protein n=1 Tax=Acanthopleuribacter pedis TaxID=442870 RepID=A0A8J7U7B1_9BACT|nr:DUF413 domain-containing protein [Acanthopleuribacter pedis]MBO1322814.1 DUF413 domain-containing protein [Acanthopleuribacter pedis]